jgi:hypothetical protein
MQTAVAAIGALVIVGALVGFVRAVWHSPANKRENGDHNSLAGMPTAPNESDHSDSGGHGGADGGGR